MIKENELIDLGILDWKSLYYNLSYEDLFKHETDSKLKGNEKAAVTNTGAVNVNTGIFTGRSPKDKYLVKKSGSEKNIWWKEKYNKSDNKSISPEIWQHLKNLSTKELNGKILYVNDCFCKLFLLNYYLYITTF